MYRDGKQVTTTSTPKWVEYQEDKIQPTSGLLACYLTCPALRTGLFIFSPFGTTIGHSIGYSLIVFNYTLLTDALEI